MKEIHSDIDFADSSYKSCEMKDGNLTVHLTSWENKTIKITFSNTIEFLYRLGSFASGIYEKQNDCSLLTEAISLYYEKPQITHPFKEFAIVDIENFSFFVVVAETVTVSEE